MLETQHRKQTKYNEVSVADMQTSITREELREIFRHEFRTFGREQFRSELADFTNPLVKLIREGTFKVAEQTEATVSPLAKVPVVSSRTPIAVLPGTIEETIVPSPMSYKAASWDDSTLSPPISPRLPDKVTSASKSTDSKMAKTSSRIISSHKGRRDSQTVGLLHHGSDKSRLHRLALKLVNHNVFDMVIAFAILLNGLVVGMQTHVMASERTDKPHLSFQVAELIFCAVFTCELALRLFAFRLKFFTMPGMVGWNVFDFVVVTAQLLELLMEAVASGLGFSFNLLRTLRLIRVLRIARTLRLIGELRTIVSSIASSMKPLFWTGVLLFMIVYVLGVYVTQVVLHETVSLREDNKEVPPDLSLYWGDLIKSIFSLFESITGGVDWDQVARPLINHIGPEMGVLYSLFITFTMFAMLNVVTGVFIQAVIENGSMETEFRTRSQVKNLFQNLDSESTGEITWEAFKSHLEKKEMREFFKTIDVDIRNAKNLFDLLDIDASGSVDCDEFLEGCLRIWAPSRGYDQQMILRDVNRLRNDVEQWIAESSGRPWSPDRKSAELKVESVCGDE